MGSINLETMKQLLHDFQEKEALAAEEINLVQQQIEELGQRIQVCHNSLQIVKEDKQKITEMMRRYSNHNNISGRAQMSAASAPASVVPNPVAPNPVAPNPVAPNPVVPNPTVPNPVVPNPASLAPTLAPTPKEKEVVQEVSIAPEASKEQGRETIKDPNKDTLDLGGKLESRVHAQANPSNLVKNFLAGVSSSSGATNSSSQSSVKSGNNMTAQSAPSESAAKENAGPPTHVEPVKSESSPAQTTAPAPVAAQTSQSGQSAPTAKQDQFFDNFQAIVPANTNQEGEPEKGDVPGTEQPEDNDDTVKSINDALRGLFR